MNTKKLFWVAAFCILSNTGLAKDSCRVDWKEYRESLSNTSRVSESLQIRSAYMDKLKNCDASIRELKEFLWLEVPLSNRASRLYWSDTLTMVSDNISFFNVLRDMDAFLRYFIYELEPELDRKTQLLRIREGLIPLSRNCGDFLILTSLWNMQLREPIQDELNEMRRLNLNRYCGNK